MNFIEACKLMERGKQVHRTGWDNPECFIGCPRINKEICYAADDVPVVDFNLNDYLAEDWEEYTEQYDFQWAVEQLKEGREVRRLSWFSASGAIHAEADKKIYWKTLGQTTTLNLEDIEAKDWVLG